MKTSIWMPTQDYFVSLKTAMCLGQLWMCLEGPEEGTFWWVDRPQMSILSGFSKAHHFLDVNQQRKSRTSKKSTKYGRL